MINMIQLSTTRETLKFPQKILAYVQLMRPANIVTAWADILAGLAVSGILFDDFAILACLMIATTGLYGGGIVFNDVFDVKLDSQERPERPLPSHRASLGGAITLGCSLFLLGIGATVYVSFISTILAVSVAVLALIYDTWGKHHPLLGPLNMGLCRGGNLWLGMSASVSIVQEKWYLALIPITYIAAITAISRGEVKGGQRITGIVSLGLLTGVLGGLLSLNWIFADYSLAMLPFWVLFAVMLLPSWINAMSHPDAENIRRAVKMGVISLIILNATIGAIFGGLTAGLSILLLFPLSKSLAQLFSVT